MLKRATDQTRSLTGQIAKKVLDDSPPDRKTKWAGVAEFIATPASSDGKAEVNKPLNLVIHLSKSRFRSTPPHRLRLTSAPAERGLDDRRNGRPTQIRQMLKRRQTSLSLEVSSPKLVGDLIVSGALTTGCGVFSLADAQT